eukprot:3359796-Pleurochrysis_carterae.AAC.1
MACAWVSSGAAAWRARQVRPRAQITVSETLEAELRKDHGEEPDTTAARRPLTQPADKALFFLTRKLISEPKIVNNTRIVVVGTSVKRDAEERAGHGVESVQDVSF